MGEFKALEGALKGVQSKAAKLPWAKERAWRVKTHLRLGGHGLIELDLHDLSVPLALEAVGLLIEAAPETGAAVLITGRGKHSGGVTRLRDAVQADLEARGLPCVPRGPGRLQVTWDAAAAGRSATGGGLLLWFVGLAGLAGAAATLWRLLFG